MFCRRSLCSCWTAFNASLVFLYISYCLFVPLLVFFHKERMLSFGEDFNAFRKTV